MLLGHLAWPECNRIAVPATFLGVFPQIYFMLFFHKNHQVTVSYGLCVFYNK